MEKESKKLNREELLREQAELARIIKESTEALNEAKKTADALQARKEKAKAEEKPSEAVEAEKPAEIAQSAETAKEENWTEEDEKTLNELKQAMDEIKEKMIKRGKEITKLKEELEKLESMPTPEPEQKESKKEEGIEENEYEIKKADIEKRREEEINKPIYGENGDISVLQNLENSRKKIEEYKFLQKQIEDSNSLKLTYATNGHYKLIITNNKNEKIDISYTNSIYTDIYFKNTGHVIKNIHDLTIDDIKYLKNDILQKVKKGVDREVNWMNDFQNEINEINAKYDAELAKLKETQKEKSFTPIEKAEFLKDYAEKVVSYIEFLENIEKNVKEKTEKVEPEVKKVMSALLEQALTKKENIAKWKQYCQDILKTGNITLNKDLKNCFQSEDNTERLRAFKAVYLSKFKELVNTALILCEAIRKLSKFVKNANVSDIEKEFESKIAEIKSKSKEVGILEIADTKLFTYLDSNKGTRTLGGKILFPYSEVNDLDKDYIQEIIKFGMKTELEDMGKTDVLIASAENTETTKKEEGIEEQAGLESKEKLGVFYAEAPNEQDGSFNVEYTTKVLIPNKSVFVFTLTSPDTATFKIIDNPDIMKRAINLYSSILIPVCRNLVAYKLEFEKVIFKEPGQVRKEGNKWVLDKKAIIELK